MMTDTLPTALPHIQAGRLHALGVSTAARSAALPELPTIAEAGVAGYETLNWSGVFAPGGTLRAITARMADAITTATARKRFRDRLAQQGMLALDATGAAFAAAARDRWVALVRAANITTAD